MMPPRDPDDLASALLDGLLTDDEAAVAQRDPAVAARLVELAAVRDAVRRPPAGPDPVARERGLAAALAAFEASEAPAEQREAGAVGSTVRSHGHRHPPTGPAAARAGTRWRPRGPAGRRWLTAAAVVLAVVGLGVLASNWDAGSDDADNAAQGGATEESSDEAGGDSSAAEGPDSGTTEESVAPSAAPGEIVDLGDVGSSDALADRARSILAEGVGRPLAEGSGGEVEAGQGAAGDADFLATTCREDADAERLAASSETVVLRGRATLEGEPVDVWVLTSDGTERVVALDASCVVVVDQPLQD
jgi:hypothetical protein